MVTWKKITTLAPGMAEYEADCRSIAQRHGLNEREAHRAVDELLARAEAVASTRAGGMTKG